MCFVALLSAAAAAALTAGQETVRPRTPTAAQEWPTYGHDPGGMRFSPVTQITPANVSQLQVAWVYHMRPAARRGLPAPRAAPRRRPPRRGRGRGRGGSGFARRRDDAARRQRRDVHRHAVRTASSRSIRRPAKRCGSSSCPSGNPSTRGVEYLARRRADAAADRVRHERRQVVLARREDRQAESRRSASKASSI